MTNDDSGALNRRDVLKWSAAATGLAVGPQVASANIRTVGETEFTEIGLVFDIEGASKADLVTVANDDPPEYVVDRDSRTLAIPAKGRGEKGLEVARRSRAIVNARGIARAPHTWRPAEASSYLPVRLADDFRPIEEYSVESSLDVPRIEVSHGEENVRVEADGASARVPANEISELRLPQQDVKLEAHRGSKLESNSGVESVRVTVTPRVPVRHYGEVDIAAIDYADASGGEGAPGRAQR